MIRSQRRRARRGTSLVECAICYSMTLQLIMGTLITGLGVFRYQQVAMLAREGARWASVHGGNYQSEQSLGGPTNSTLQTYLTTNYAVALDTTKLTCTLPTATKGTVSVTVAYSWVPEGYWGSVPFASTSTMPVTY